MRRAAAFLLLLALPVSAQCGSPCEPVKWPLPTWPALVSPTPFVPDTAPLVPTPTGTPPTATPSPSLTPDMEVGDIGEAVGTLQHIMQGTVPAIANASGTPFTIDNMLATAEADTTHFWSYSKGIAESNFLGPFSPFAGLLLVFLLLLMLVKGSTFLLPIGVALLGVIRKVITLVLDFLPF